MKRIIILLLLIFIVSPAYASEDKTSAANNNEILGSSDPIISDDFRNFIRAAISESNWQNSIYDKDTDIPYIMPEDNSFKQSVQDHLAHLSEYIYRRKGVPPSNVINKWPQDKTIKIGLGWPKYIQPYPYPLNNLSDKEKDTLKALIKENVELIKAASGLNIEVLSTEDQENYGQFRIIVANRSYFLKNSTKLSRKITPFTHQPLFHEYYEPAYIGAVPFTPWERSSVDGYFLPSVTNEIKSSVCYIVDDHINEDMRCKIPECLMRGFGFPDKIESLKPSVLSNSCDDDRKKAQGLFEQDRKFLEYLYRSDISSGDNYWQVYDKLTISN